MIKNIIYNPAQNFVQKPIKAAEICISDLKYDASSALSAQGQASIRITIKAKQELIKQLDGLELDKCYKDKMLEHFKTRPDIETLSNHIKTSGKYYGGRAVKLLSLLSPEQIQDAKKILFIKGRTQQLDGTEICHMVQTHSGKDNYINNFLDFANIKGRNADQQFHTDNIIALCSLKGKAIDNAKDLAFISNSKKQFSARALWRLAQIDEKSMEKLKTMDIASHPRIFDLENDSLNKFIEVQLEGNAPLKKPTSHLLKNNLYNNEAIEEFLGAYPESNRNIGAFPTGWMNKIPKEKKNEISKQIHDAFGEFAQTTSGSRCDIPDAKAQIEVLSKKLTVLLKQDVSIKYIDHGYFGKVYKVKTPNGECCLKTFFEDNFSPEFHGKQIEIQAGLHAKKNARANQFAKFHFGRIGLESDKDTFMVTEFVRPGKKIITKRSDAIAKSEPVYLNHVYSTDDNEKNMINNKIVDYGTYQKSIKYDDKKLKKLTRLISQNFYKNTYVNGQVKYAISDKNKQTVENLITNCKDKKTLNKALLNLREAFNDWGARDLRRYVEDLADKINL